MGCLSRLALIFLVFAAFCALAISAFYVEENARGAREWATTQKNLQSLGETYQFADLIPPAIPNSQNLAALPLFKVEIDPRDSSRQSLVLKAALSNLEPINGPSFPKTGHWPKIGLTDLGPVRKFLVDHYQQAFGHAALNVGPLEQIDALCPAINQLRAAASTRKIVRFNRDYVTQPPYERAFAPLTELIRLVKVINLHAIVALSENKPDVALSDIELTLQLGKGVAREPILISGMVSIMMVSIQSSSISEGLGRHAWNTQQLDELQNQLQSIDFVSDCQLCFRGEETGFFAPNSDWIRDHRRSAARLFFGPVNQLLRAADDDSSEANPRRPYVAELALWLVPRGWFDMIKARGVSIYFQAARELADIGTRSVDAAKTDQLSHRDQSLSCLDFPNLILEVTVRPVIHAAQDFGEGQFRVEALSLACALENYRLAKGVYPVSLGDLPSTVKLPADPVGGGPYHYKLLPDKSYLLYSVGWNRKDDGGTMAHPPGIPNTIDWENGDWVWPTP